MLQTESKATVDVVKAALAVNQQAHQLVNRVVNQNVNQNAILVQLRPHAAVRKSFALRSA